MTLDLLASPFADLLGNTEPRLFTPPLRELTPETSYGFAVIDFARDTLGEPLDPWEEWFVIHGGELLPNGWPRFRQVLLLVARQNGKSHIVKVLQLFWLFIEKQPLTLTTSTNLTYVRDALLKVVYAAQANPTLAAMIPKHGHRQANGDASLSTIHRTILRTAASNATGGRSLTINRCTLDELREHHTWDAYNAAEPACSPMDTQIFMLTNQGDDKSVVLDTLREQALAGEDPRFGLFEWSAPDGAEIDDPQAWCAANPNLGRRLDPNTFANTARRIKASGDEEAINGFRTEKLCQKVKTLNAAISPEHWTSGAKPGDMEKYRGRVALCLDISPDGLHATLCAAAVIKPGLVRVGVVRAWDGLDCTKQLLRDLPGWIATVKPRMIGWFPNGPAAAIAVEMGKTRRPGWPPVGVLIEEIKSEMTAVCMGFAKRVLNDEIEHPEDKLLDAHVLAVEKLMRGDSWVFSRKGGGQCDAAYAAAGAVHLALTLPMPKRTSVPMTDAVRAEVERMRAERQT